jgi:adenylate cyclase
MSVLDDERLYAGAERGEERRARRALLERLVQAGVDHERLLAAVEEERLAILPAELVLGGNAPYTLSEVARRSGLPPKFLRQVLLALGRPNPRRGERAFTDADVAEAEILRVLLDAGLPRAGVLQVARVIGQGMSNTAHAVRELVGAALLKRGDTEHELALRYAGAAEQLGPLMGPLLGNELLAHIREAIRREAVSQAEREAGVLHGTREIAVGFGDLVDFTKLGGEVEPEELGQVAGRLTELATAVTGPPVQLVKTIGDAVMLVSPEVRPLVEAFSRMVVRAAGAGTLPELRVGVAYGPAVPRGGDWFGATVNRASRLTAAAKPGTIIVDARAHEHVSEDYEWSRPRRKALKGVGRTRYFRLSPQPG